MRLASWTVFLLAGVLMLTACNDARQVESFLWPESEGVYYRVVKEWTRSDEVYSGFEGQISVVATLKSSDWRRAYVQEKSTVFHWTEEKKENFARTMQDNAERNTEFFLALHGSDKDHARLKYDSSLWDVFVQTDEGERVYPMGIREVDTPPAELSHFFPYVTRWKKTYTLTFPKVREKDISLIITGPAGKLDLHW